MKGEKLENIDEIETDLVPLSEAAKKTGYTPEYLNFLCRKGKLKASKIGRNWHTTKDWLDEFLRSSSERKVKAAEADSPLAGFAPKADCPLGEAGMKFKIFAWMSSAIIIMPLLFAGTYFVKSATLNQALREEWRIAMENNPENVIVNEEGVVEENRGIVLGEEDKNIEAPKSKTALSSESFRIQQLSVGGEIMTLVAAENVPLEIFDVKSESFVSSKKEEEVKLIVSWKTNKPAMSEIEYSRNNGQFPKSVKENSYGFNHSVVISDLEPRTSYVYVISAKDKWANAKKSDYFGVYTASKPVSVFDMISGAMNETFGWAVSKQ